MKNKEELLQWIKGANAYAPIIPGYKNEKPVSLPLLTGLTLRGNTQDYIANADFVIPNNGDIILRKRIVRFQDVKGNAPLEGGNWNHLREDRVAYKWVVNDLKHNPIKLPGLVKEIPEVPSTPVEPVVPDVPKVDPKDPEGDSRTPKAPGESTTDKAAKIPNDAPKKDDASADTEVVIPPETPNLNSMSKKKIDKWALTQGIEVDGRMSKSDMIAFVEAALVK